MKSILIGCWLVLCLLSLSVQAERLDFEHQQHRLAGHYLKAHGAEPARALLVFVHGDGAMPYDAHGFYPLLWEPLRQAGYAIYSWDKAGVGDSPGDWLQQSAVDRQAEVRAAVAAVQRKYPIEASRVGLLGFSQAGWVVPALAAGDDPIGFFVGIGFARDWIAQGRYFERQKLKEAGASSEEVSQGLELFDAGIEFLQSSPDYPSYLAREGKHAMSPERFAFVMKNFRVDAVADIAQISIPSLLLWGEKDLNVDARSEHHYWRETFSEDSGVTLRLLANANHGLLDAGAFKRQHFGVRDWLRMLWRGQRALSPELMPLLITWLDSVTEPPGRAVAGSVVELVDP